LPTAVLLRRGCCWAPALQELIRDDTIRDAILTCNQKLTGVSLNYHTQPTIKKWKEEKLKSRKTDMRRSIGK